MSVSGRRSPVTRVVTAGLVVGLALLGLGAAPPDDPLVGQQHHLATVGTFEAWDVRRGEGAVVAVLDTGVDLDHPDLAGRLVEGIDLVEPGTPPDDPQGHGTIVAGVIVAVAGNGRGVAGVAPRAQVLPIRVLDAQGRGTADTVAEGIRHAISAGVQVINLSLAEVEPDEESAEPTEEPDGPLVPLLPGAALVQDDDVRDAIDEAAEAGIMVVAAAGNDGRDATPYEPEQPVLVVGATDTDGRRWVDSNADDRTLFAPGTEILSTWSEARYARSDGTSFATPVVAAGAAMLMGAGLTREDAAARLVDTATPLYDLGPSESPPPEGATPSPAPDTIGVGVVDLAAAVQGLPVAPPPTETVAPAPTQPQPAPPAPAPAPSQGGALEDVEQVQEVPAQPTGDRVTVAPPDIVAAEPGAEAPPSAPPLEPVQVVTEPTASAGPATTPPPAGTAPPLVVESGASQDDRAAAMTVATMLLGADVLLAGWVLAGRRPRS